MHVVICGDPAAWDTFVEASPAASNYHLWKWRTPIQETFGHRPFYLAAMENGAVAGVLPLFFLGSRIFGKALISVPFFSYGGPVASSVEAREVLLRSAARLALNLAIPRIELRQGSQDACAWTDSCNKVAMEVSLPPSADELWGRLSSRLRNKIRHATASGLETEWGGIELVPDFYKVFATNMRNLGTPVYPRAWFRNLCRCAPASTEVVLLRSGRRPVAAAFLSRYRRAMEVPWICSTPDCRRDYSSVLLYWTFLKRAIESGCESCDLGRCTPGGGTYSFKRLWGCTERPLHWYHWQAPGQPPPDLCPDNPKFRMAVQMWRHLPLFVANALGPRVVRSLP